ncbi:MAG: hypothetical protein K2O24_00155 [Muribaculaceae bacterium]|nr:hypothetical protein [Muribaculaceae bacterium]
MKKILLCGVIALAVGITSCNSLRHTATTVDVNTELFSRSTADLKVSSNKISYTLKPTKAMRKAGEKAVIETAVAEALKANGNADVLVGMQYEIKKRGKKVKYVTVTGYPASYVNITPIR